MSDITGLMLGIGLLGLSVGVFGLLQITKDLHSRLLRLERTVENES